MICCIAVVLLLGIHQCTSYNMHFDRDKGLVYDLYPLQRLTLEMLGTKQKSVQVEGKMECLFACTGVDWCRSVNLKTTPQISGRYMYICELISSDRYTHKNNMTQDKAFNHYSVQVGGRYFFYVIYLNILFLDNTLTSRADDDTCLNEHNC